MHIKSVRINSYKRFHDLTIDDLPASAKLVVLAGPNGSGKSSLFDALRTWHSAAHAGGFDNDVVYYQKAGTPQLAWNQWVQIEFHEPIPPEPDAAKKLLYIRSAYRNDPDFSLTSLQRVGSILDAPKAQKMILNDVSVSYNYQRLVSASVAGLYSGQHDALTVEQLREQFIGDVRASMNRIFADLILSSLGDPLEQGSFFFEKGASRDFHYKNLSGGEKAAFDLILDVIVKRSTYNDTVYCIDEPETHLNTRLQGALLKELVNLLPDRCQLWISTHSIGMMTAARDMKRAHPDQVIFLEFQGHDFDTPVTLEPVEVDRSFWARTLGVALDDLASLVAPALVILCEGRRTAPPTAKAEFDARCYRTIFAREYPDVDFLSIGNEEQVRTDKVGIGKAIQTIIGGTTVIQLVDRDDRSEQEVADLQDSGVRVLSLRHLEAYLLHDEVLTKLCEVNGQVEKVPEVIAIKAQALANSIERGNPADDLKSAAGQIFTQTRTLMGLRGSGNTVDAFLRDTMAPLITPDMKIYRQLRHDIFNE